MTIDMTKHFHQSNLIEGFNSKEADACLARAWAFLIGQDKLSNAVILKTQKLATLHQKDMQPDWRGYYRKIPVWIGRKEALSYWLIQDHMTAWLYRTEQNNRESAKEAHITFEKIHPFVDGNGRTGRLLMWWQEIKNGDKPALIKFIDRLEYYEWFR